MMNERSSSCAARETVILNRYPYTSGHVLIVPYAHQAKLEAQRCRDAGREIMEMAKKLEPILEGLYLTRKATIWE